MPNLTMLLTIVVCLIIIIALFYFLMKPTEKNIVGAPSMLTSFGIFGTFLGIAIGLTRLDPQNIVASVPIFLDGIKLAFWSSVVGISAAIIHRFKFMAITLPGQELTDGDADDRALTLLGKMSGSLENLIALTKERETTESNLNQFSEKLVTVGDQVHSGLKTISESLKDDLAGLADRVSDQARSLTEELKSDQSVLEMLSGLKAELAENSESRRQLMHGLENIAKDRESFDLSFHDLGDVLADLGTRLQAGLESVSGSMDDGFNVLSHSVSEQARTLTDELKNDQTVLEMVMVLKDELAKNSESRQQLSQDLQLIARDRENAEERLYQFGEKFVELGEMMQENLKIMSGSMDNGFIGLAQSLSEQVRTLTDELKNDQSVLDLLVDLKGELAKNSESRQQLMHGLEIIAKDRESAEQGLYEFGEKLVDLGEQVQGGLQAMSGSLKNDFATLAVRVAEQARALTSELKADDSVLNLLGSLRDELVNTSQAEQNVMKNQIQQLLELIREDAGVRARQQAETFTKGFGDLQEQIEKGSEISREVSKQQMEELFSGLNRAATGAFSRLTDMAGDIIEQTRTHGEIVAGGINEASEASTKAMLVMLDKIVATTDDSNRRVVSELLKLRTDIAANMKMNTDQAKALTEQLQTMTESYKASLITTTTDLKTQISKDMKSSYNLIDQYTKSVADVTGSNQLEALERLEAIANIMQNVVKSSSDMSGLLHENTVAMANMKDALTGTNEGSLGRFLQNINEKLIDKLSSVENSLAAQGSLGVLMGNLNNEIIKHFKSLEKVYENNTREVKQLPKEIVRGLSELQDSGRGLMH